MAQTAWSPAPYLSKQEWLLADGSIITSPDFETSTSGRRVRVVGTKESIGSRQVDTLVQASIDKIAQERGTTRLCRVFPDQESDAHAASLAGAPESVFTDALTLHLLNQQQRGDRGRSVAVWKFSADGAAPIHAWVFATLSQTYGDRYEVNAHVVYRDTRVHHTQNNHMLAWDGRHIQGDDMYRYSDEHGKLVDWFQNKNIFPGEHIDFATKNYNSQLRVAVVKFAELCRKIDQYDEITLPQPENTRAVRKFNRTASNYSASFNASLLDFVQTGPVLDRIQENYAQLLVDLKTLGIVVTESINGGDLAQALAGKLTKIAATVNANEDEDESGNSVDPYHSVAFDFATGTVVVNCGHKENLNETAEAWEIAKFKAELTGETDVLLEYARAYRDPKEQARLRKIIKQRKVDLT